jgi:hypothetical protein
MHKVFQRFLYLPLLFILASFQLTTASGYDYRIDAKTGIEPIYIAPNQYFGNSQAYLLNSEDKQLSLEISEFELVEEEDERILKNRHLSKDLFSISEFIHGLAGITTVTREAICSHQGFTGSATPLFILFEVYRL